MKSELWERQRQLEMPSTMPPAFGCETFRSLWTSSFRCPCQARAITGPAPTEEWIERRMLEP